MEPNSKSDGSTMGPPLPAAARRNSFVPVSGFLIFLVIGFWCLPLCGAGDASPSEFETPPPDPGSIQWETTHRATRDNQERYRKRVSIPDAIGGNVPEAASASMVNGPKTLLAKKPLPAATSGAAWKAFLIATMCALSGLLVVRKMAPQVLVDLNQRYNPWAVAPVVVRDSSAKVRAEEEAFVEFLKEFRIGPAAAPHPDVPRKVGHLNEFYARAKERLATLRTLLQDVGRQSDDVIRQDMLKDLQVEAGTLKDEAGLPEVLPVWQMTFALEGLLKQLTEKAKNITPSTLRTVAGGLDLLDNLCVSGSPADLLADRPLRFLVVDDDPISCQALSASLERAFSQPDVTRDGETALVQAASRPYDVIFLDVQMPGMDGFELCTKIRSTAPNRATPVVFVTVQSDFDARCKSTLSGGNDLMGKPFLTFEVTVKAFTLALQGRLRAHAPEPLAKADPALHLGDSSARIDDGPRLVPSFTTATRPPLLPSLPTGMDDIANAFLIRMSKQLDPLWELCQTILQISNPETRQTLLADGFLRINSLIPRPGPEVVHPAYQMSTALEGLLRKMLQDSRYATPSALGTMANAVALLTDLCLPGLKADLAINPSIQMLVVDDDLVARRSLVGALQTAFQKPESAENGESALTLALERPFDVIFLDVVMPGMDGFQVCSKIRQTPPNRATPVVFVTGQSDFDARAQMSRNGGDDLIGKPFLTSEVTVKALTFALHGRLQQLKTPACS